MEYGHLKNGNIVRAPRIYRDGDTYNLTPKEADHFAHGNKRLHLSPPTDPAPEGTHYESDGHDETETDITRRWKTVENPKIYRAWTPLTIMRAAKSDGVWDALKTALGGADAIEEFIACHYVAECDAAFESIYAVIKQTMGDAVDAFVDALKVERTGTREELSDGEVA